MTRRLSDHKVVAVRRTPRKDTRYVTILTVYVPDAQALIDMMRYDCCYPASEADARKINDIARHESDGMGRVVRLVRVARTSDPPTHGRWKSFAAAVLDWRHPEEPEITNEEIAALLELHDLEAIL